LAGPQPGIPATKNHRSPAAAMVSNRFRDDLARRPAQPDIVAQRTCARADNGPDKQIAIGDFGNRRSGKCTGTRTFQVIVQTSGKHSRKDGPEGQ
jgi:hypothetical protein